MVENRQLLVVQANLGEAKAEEAALRVAAINSAVRTEILSRKFGSKNTDQFLSGLDVVLDCLDNVGTRLLLEQRCKVLGIPLVHGAVGAWSGQVLTILPGDDTLYNLYGADGTPIPPIGAASFIPATIASYQVAECIKLLIGRGDLLRRRMMCFDLWNNHQFVVDLDD